MISTVTTPFMDWSYIISINQVGSIKRKYEFHDGGVVSDDCIYFP